MERLVFRGNVYIVNLGDTIGSVQGGMRPCVVLSNDVNNAHSPTVQVVPLTSSEKTELPIHYTLDAKGHTFLKYDSIALTEQFTTIDKSQIQRYIGTLDKCDIDDILSRFDIQLGRITKETYYERI